MNFQVALLFNFVTRVNHPPHERVSSHTILPVAIPRFEVGYLLFSVLKDECHCPQRLNSGLNCDPESLRAEISLIGLMPLLMDVIKTSINTSERTSVCVLIRIHLSARKDPRFLASSAWSLMGFTSAH